MKRILLTIALAIMLLCFAPSTHALQYSGTLTSAGGGIVGTADWASGVSLSWVVNNTSNPGFWTYTYTWSDTTSQFKALSHIIIELSPDVKNISVSGANVKDFEINTYSGSDPSNQNMPGPMYGIKINTSNDPVTFTFSLITVRAPVWGDFYAKDGTTNQLLNSAWNAGFLAADPNNAPADGTINNHILRPDTEGVMLPEPGTMILLGLGLLGLGIVVRKRF